ncbi:AAA family ATPase [Candidatus Woesearchaeota archaeon]|nr:AAA family ATPase [Candidatus Woesearchaeota archaeon]
MGKGCILLLDELPKIDPNTAGILNSVLASVGEYQNGEPTTIQNAKGDVIQRGKIFIMATGNSLLNTKDAEYEANFKQDLSLQDRFAGSTYKVFVDEKFEWEGILFQKWAFIFLYLTKLRKLIVDEGFTSKAFVSIRLMQSVQKTYNVFRQVSDQTGGNRSFTETPDVSYTPANVEGALGTIQASSVKTVKDSLDEFFSLFTEEQAKILKEKSDYDAWLNIVDTKNKLPMDSLNTQTELDEVDSIING